MNRAVKQVINPYRRRAGEFPGRLFDADRHGFEDFLKHTVPQKYSQIICEIGSGSGNHLIEIARLHPDSCCLGFELRFKRAVRTIEKAQVSEVSNIFVVRGSWQEFSPSLRERSLSAVYINYPDPWEKPKRQKHRILSKTLLEQLRRLLKLGGRLCVKTDHRGYFQDFLNITETCEHFKIEEVTFDLFKSEWADKTIPTEFERLFRSQGLPICYAKLVLTGTSGA